MDREDPTLNPWLALSALKDKKEDKSQAPWLSIT
jgi:hypothetical protein